MPRSRSDAGGFKLPLFYSILVRDTGMALMLLQLGIC